MVTLQDKSLNLALTHALEVGDTDVFPTPFEFEAINHNWDDIKPLLKENLLDWNTRPHRFMLAPKGEFGFRVVTQLDPLDLLVFTATLIEIGEDLESGRVNDSIVFSYRYSPSDNGKLYDTSTGYQDFQDRCERAILEDNYNYVATADIADFYHRIYLHRLENALRNETDKSSHVNAIMNFLSGWNETESYGIPVGCSASHLMSEITISDIDNALLSRNIAFARYNDDYRIFANSYEEAYRSISFLADILHRNHGLNLQPRKTDIIPRDKFYQDFLTNPEDQELNKLHGQFRALAESLGLTNFYDPIDYEDLDEEGKEMVDSLNLINIISTEIDKRDVDFGLLKFSLRRLNQLSDPEAVNILLNNLNKVHPIFPDIINYLRGISNDYGPGKEIIGSKVLDLFEDSIVSEIDYHKIWALSMFTESREWGNEDRLFSLLQSTFSQSVRRSLILSIGRNSARHWFKSQRRNLFNRPKWERRAIIAGSSCMTPDARKHWYQSLEPRLDPLETAVMKWARNNPFS